MTEHGLGMLQYAAAVPAPLRFDVRAPDGKQSRVEVPAPVAVIGRGEDCDLCIPHEGVSSRQVYLQAIGNRIACTDLHTPSGTPVEGAPFHGWLDSSHALRVGDWTVQLADDCWSAEDSLKPPLEFRPRDEHRQEYGALPKVDLELLNTSLKGKMWPINRVLTLLGRDPKCRITVLDARLSRVHCSFLLLPSGLWVIDLLGKGGIRVNDQPSRCMILSEGNELQIGSYKLSAHYPQLPKSAEAGTLQAQYLGSGSDFLTRQNKIFQVEFYHDTLIVVPLGDSQDFFYQDIHIEASRVMEVIQFHRFQHVVIDFSRAEAAGHILLESMTSFCRAAPGKSALCGANARTYSTLKSTPLYRKFDHYATRQEALQAVYMPDE